MPSAAHDRWQRERLPALDELESAHQSVGVAGRGRRYATQQINQAYAVLLSSQFQGYCRDLHTECVDHVVRTAIGAPALRAMFLGVFLQGRKLDRGNPNPGNIGADFGRFGLVFWSDVRQYDQRTVNRMARLEELNDWRNAVAHQDFTSPRLGGQTGLTLARVRGWRRACETLAVTFEVALRAHLLHETGTPPW